MGLFTKPIVRPYRLRISPLSYYGSDRKRARKFLKKFCGKHNGFDVVENLIINPKVMVGDSLRITLSCDDKTRDKINALLKANGHDELFLCYFNTDFLIRRGFINSADDKETRHKTWIYAEY